MLPIYHHPHRRPPDLCVAPRRRLAVGLLPVTGLLWQLANATANRSRAPLFAAAAARFTAARAPHAHDATTHDVGFVIYDSYGAGLALAPDGSGAIDRRSYTAVVATAAHTLATRYAPVVGMVRSWGAVDDDSQFEVVVDSLMNLELLLHVGGATRNATLTAIARSHALRTAALWLRADGSTAHLCVLSPATGRLLRPCTATPQGLGANSTWARGQAWAIYGLTMAHRYLGDAALLEGARRAADYFLRGGAVVPAWDFDAPAAEAWPDASAAAIAASGLLELSKRAGNASYRDAAVTLVKTLASDARYLAPASRSPAVLGACRHDCGAAECSLIESDYYVYEAVRRLRSGLSQRRDSSSVLFK